MTRRKKIGILGGVVLALFVIGMLLINTILSAGTRLALVQGGEYALGVPTEVDDVDLRIFRGRARIQGLRIANPPGFEKPNFLEAGRIEARVRWSTVLSPPVEVEYAETWDLFLDLDQRGEKANYDILAAHASKAFPSDPAETDPAPAEPPEADAEAGASTVVIDRLTLTRIKVRMATEEDIIQASIPQIELKNVGGEEGVTVSQLNVVIVQAIVDSILENPRMMPKLMRRQLGAWRRKIDVGSYGGKTIGVLTSTTEKVSGKILDVGKDLEKGIEGAAGRLGGSLFGEPETKPKE